MNLQAMWLLSSFELQILPADEFAEEDLSFRWTITEFKEDQMTIELDFAHPEDISIADKND